MSSAGVPEFGPNDWFVEEKYQQFLADPQSVDPIWRDFFSVNGSGKKAGAQKAAGNGDRVQQREQPAPRVADERERLERELTHESREILDMCPPGDGRAILTSRTSAAALVVEDQPVVARKLEHLRQEIVVRRTRAAVQHEQPGCVFRSVCGVKELHARTDYGCNATAGVL